MRAWAELGVRADRRQGAARRATRRPRSCRASTRHFLVDPNYDAILEYNCAHSYAITVALLGDAIASNKAPAAPKPSKSAKPKRKRR